MAYARNYDSRDSRSYSNSLNLQKERERTKKKREQQFDSREKCEPKPVFSEPRKISTSMQDPLSLTIQNVLGDPQNFDRNILSSNDPNIWLGTSRSQNTNTPATPTVPESSEPPLGHQFTLKKIYNNSSNHKKSSQHRSSSDYRSSSDRQNNRSSSRDRHGNKHYSSGSSGSTMRSKSSRTTESPHNKLLGYSSNNSSKHDNNPTANTASTTTSDKRDLSLLQDELMDDVLPSKVSERLSERSRMSSVDSDYSGVEKIFEIMKVQLEPLTPFQTPSANHEDAFRFDKYTKRKEAQLDSDVVGGHKLMSDSDTSDESSDEEEENKTSVDKWLLGVPEDPLLKKPPSDVKKRESERVKSKQHADKISNNNNHRKKSTSRGRESLTKHSRSTNHSSTSSHRSESSDRGSVKSQKKSGLSPKPHPTKTNRFLQRKSPVKGESKSSSLSNSIQSKSNPHQFVARKGINNGVNQPEPCKSDESDVPPVADSHDSDSSSYHSDSSSSDSEVDEPKQSRDWGLGSIIASQQTNQINEQQTNEHTVKQQQHRDHNAIDSSHSKPSSHHGNQSKSPNRPNSSSRGDITNSSKSIKSQLKSSLSIKFHCYLFNKSDDRTNKFANKLKNERFIEPSTVSHHAKYEERKVSPCHMPTISTGSETDQPLRRANTVQLADADGSKVWPDSTSTSKRKPEPYNNQSKRRKQEQSPNQNQHINLSPSPWRCDKKQELSPHKRNQHERTPTTQHSSSRRHNQTNRTSATPGVAAIVPEPDSSWPEQERLQTADQYMCEGKRLKHEGDGLTDSRTGKTWPGKHHKRALAYFEAALCFIMTGYVMEIENNSDRSDTGSSSGSSSASHSPSNMYLQTVQLLDYVLKMRPTSDHIDLTFKRIFASCHRCQSVLYFRIYKLKKDVALKYSELLTDQFKTSKSNRTPSPWHHTATQPNVLSPMSPAVQSPFPMPIPLLGPSPVGVNNNGAEVSSSTQPGKMTPTHNSVVIPQKTYDVFRQHHNITCNLLKAHEKWDQAEQYSEEHKDFFRNIDTLCSRTLSFHSSLRDVVVYNRVILHQLRAVINGSPRDPHT